MVRSRNIPQEDTAQAKDALRKKFGSIQVLADYAGLSHATVANFINGKPIYVENFNMLLEALELEPKFEGSKTDGHDVLTIEWQVSSKTEDPPTGTLKAISDELEKSEKRINEIQVEVEALRVENLKELAALAEVVKEL